MQTLHHHKVVAQEEGVNVSGAAFLRFYGNSRVSTFISLECGHKGRGTRLSEIIKCHLLSCCSSFWTVCGLHVE